jgi:hypothetical protein
VKYEYLKYSINTSDILNSPKAWRAVPSNLSGARFCGRLEYLWTTLKTNVLSLGVSTYQQNRRQELQGLDLEHPLPEIMSKAKGSPRAGE